MSSSAMYSKFARLSAHYCGRPPVFMLALMLIAVWLVTGPFFHFSDTWQLVINTGTTVITFLMVFLIQNTQNRDTEAMQMKLDELIRATQGATNVLLDLEDLEEENVEEFKRRYRELAALARKQALKDAENPDPPTA